MTSQKLYELSIGPIMPPKPPGVVNIDAANEEVAQKAFDNAQRAEAERRDER